MATELKITDIQSAIIIHALEAQIETYNSILARHRDLSLESRNMLNNAIKAREDLIKLINLS